MKSVEDTANQYLCECNNNDDEEHARRITDVTKLKSYLLRQNTVIAVITAMVIISLGKTHYGALSGWIAHMIYGGGTSDLLSWYRSYRNHVLGGTYVSSTENRREDENNEVHSESTHISSRP